MLNRLGSPAIKRGQDAKLIPEVKPLEGGGGSGGGGSVAGGGGSGGGSTKEDTVTENWYDSLGGVDQQGNLTISSTGVGGGLAGLGALGGALLPSQGTSMWKRFLYSLLGAGILGTAGYYGTNYLGNDDGGINTGWQVGTPTTPAASEEGASEEGASEEGASEEGASEEGA